MGRQYSIEVCAGAGGQALGLEEAGFTHLDLVEIDKGACETLRVNRPEWRISEGDLREFPAWKYKGIDLFAGGLPCPPFSKAGKQLGNDDERDLFPIALELISECRPRAVMIENVPGFLEPRFEAYRTRLKDALKKLGFVTDWKICNAADFGVSQLRPRVIIVAIRPGYADRFTWPEGGNIPSPTVGEALYDLMASQGWQGAANWRSKASKIAPTIVGGSKKHGGPDLGPTRARLAWAKLGVNGLTVADAPPDESFGYDDNPKLTVRMVARLQGFPDTWQITGRKTNAYRQVGLASD